MILDPKVLRSYRKEMEKALEMSDYESALSISERLSNGRIATILKDHDDEVAIEFLNRLDPERASGILSLIPVELSTEWIRSVSMETAIGWIRHMPSDSATDLLNELPDSLADSLIEKLPAPVRRSIEELRVYERDSVGAYMNTIFVAVPGEATIEETLTAIHDAPQQIENRSYVYVVNRDDRLIGVVSIKDLIRTPKDRPIDSVMNPDIVAIHPADPALESAQLLRNRRVQMLPVVEDGQLVGVLQLDDAMQILSRNLVDQFVHIGAASEDESFYTPPIGSVKKRLPWMAGNVFLNLGAVAVISSFEGTIEAVAALAVFLPMITDMGGNVGIQALSVSIRSIALGEVRLNEYWRASKKEVIVGLINGLALGLLFALLAILLRGSPVLGVVAGTALAANVFVAGIVGGTLPFFIKKLGYDPAMVTGPVLTTITDITGVTIYLGLSTMFLSSLLAG